MSAAPRGDGNAIRVAMALAGAMIAFQVGGRAGREALFLTAFPVTELPRMVAAAAVVALLSALLATRAMARWGPARFLPALFGASAALLLAEYALSRTAPRLVAVGYYLHFSAAGALLVSGFWSLINERFDLRTAKRSIGRISAAGTAGGAAGGLLAAGAASIHQSLQLFLLLALLHLGCAALVLALGRGGPERALPDEPPAHPLRTMNASPYLRTLAAIVVLVTLCDGLIDYVFKAAARDAWGDGEALLRAFAVFYTWTNLLGAVVAALLGRPALERLGLARTVGLLPWTIAVTGAGALALPGIISAMFARGSESVVRNSLYRSAYELLFTPLPAREKRAVKAVLDVGLVRLGDILAAALVQVAIVLAATQATTVMLALAIAGAAAGIALAVRIQSGYVATLERNLLAHAIHLEMSDVEDATTRSTIVRTAVSLPVAGRAPEKGFSAAPRDVPAAVPADPAASRLAELRSRDAARVKAALRSGPLEAEHVATAIALLAWNDVAAAAAEALGEAASRHTGQLVDALLDPDAEFAVRRRITAPLARARSQRAMDGLLAGLHDRRFEVRYRCGRALTRLAADAPQLAVPPESVYAAVLREAEVDRQVWESQRLLESVDDDPMSLGAALKERASRSLEHVFTMLSLVLPRQPLQIAFRGLHTTDPMLRGTALEYLEIALPDRVRQRLWPFLDDSPSRARRGRPDAQVMADLLGSGASIAANLATLDREDRSA